jgi:hypothetical protein
MRQPASLPPFYRGSTEDGRGLLDDIAYLFKIARQISSVKLRGEYGEPYEGFDSLSRKLRRAVT